LKNINRKKKRKKKEEGKEKRRELNKINLISKIYVLMCILYYLDLIFDFVEDYDFKDFVLGLIDELIGMLWVNYYR